MTVHSMRIQILAILVSLGLLVLVLSLIRSSRLKEQYAILWLLAVLGVLVLAVWKDLLDIIARFLGIVYAPSLLVLVSLFFGVLLFLHFSTVISSHSKKITRLSQEIALLQEKLEDTMKGKNLLSDSNAETKKGSDLS